MNTPHVSTRFASVSDPYYWDSSDILTPCFCNRVRNCPLITNKANGRWNRSSIEDEFLASP